MRSEYGYETYLLYSNRWQNWPRHINRYREPPPREYESARVRHAMAMLDSCLFAMFEARDGKCSKLYSAIRLYNSGERINAIKVFHALHPEMTLKEARAGIEAEVSLANSCRRVA